jgi:hypothetical protein
MATSLDTEVKPDHVIIWCDKNMAVEGNNEASKATLGEKANLNLPEPTGYCPEIDDFICNINPYLNQSKFDALIKSPLRMFISQNECMKCINDSIEANKRVFLITSGEMGALIIPELHKKPEVYKKLSGSIYIFCGRRDLHAKWTGPYEKDIVIYDDDKGVFAKVLLDIGVYYLIKGQNGTGNPASATQYFYWAKRLIKSATKVDGIKRDDYLKCIQEELSDLHAAPTDGYDSDVQIGVSANDDLMIS